MKVGLNQRNRPTPLWFRRLRDGMINFLLPGLGQLIGALDLTDQEAKNWLTILTFLPAGLNFIGVLLGEEVKKSVKVWAILISVALAASACSSTKDIAAEQSRERAKRLEQLEQVRKALPCVPDTIRHGVTEYLPSDTVLRADTVVITRRSFRVDTLYVLDEASLAAVRDSLAQAQYVLGLKDEHILALQGNYNELSRNSKKWRSRFWRLGGIVFGAAAAWFIFSGKIPLILKPFKWLISILR